MSARIAELRSARVLVSPEFFQRWTKRMVELDGLSPELAERAADAALAYLATSATKAQGEPSLSPSPLADIGWHRFLEYTEPYDEFFSSRGWGKAHHYPHDVPGRVYEPGTSVLPRTVAAIERAGWRVNADDWTGTKVSCGGDDSDGKQGDPLPCGDHG